jgi:oligopeptide transport system substrate-binding protein
MKPTSILILVFALTLSGCTSDSQYFGKPSPPSVQRLSYSVNQEVGSLDPGTTLGGTDGYIVLALFEGLISYHPQTLEPMAALATHYEVNADQTQFTFYLRGHPKPRGIKLPDTDTLREQYKAGKLNEDFAHGHSAPPDSTPAVWSDGTMITAHDFVYSWRRAASPATASPNAYLFDYVKNGKNVIEEKLKPEELGVRALDDFTFQVELERSTSFFLKMLPNYVFLAVPRHVIQAARQRGLESSWTQPGHIVTSGAFMLRDWRPREKVVVVKNPKYYEADLVQLKEISFFPILDGMTNINLYKAGQIDAVPTGGLSHLLLPILDRRKDLRITPALFSQYYVINTKKPPFDNVLVRYALNMATDKKTITDFVGGESAPALNLIPPIDGYDAPQSLLVTVGGKTYDVLSYNPAAARELLAKAGFPNGMDREGRRINADILFTILPNIQGIPLILQQQWRKELNIDVTLVNREFKVWAESVLAVNFNSVAEYGTWPDYPDPNPFLDQFLSGPSQSGTGWADPKFDAMLKDATLTTDPDARMKKLAECERYLLQAMPFIPMLFNTWFHLQKPYAHGLGENLLDKHIFKYAWIDTNWKP